MECYVQLGSLCWSTAFHFWIWLSSIAAIWISIAVLFYCINKKGKLLKEKSNETKSK